MRGQQSVLLSRGNGEWSFSATSWLVEEGQARCSGWER